MRLVHKLKWRRKKEPVPSSSPALPQIRNSLLVSLQKSLDSEPALFPKVKYSKATAGYFVSLDPRWDWKDSFWDGHRTRPLGGRDPAWCLASGRGGGENRGPGRVGCLSDGRWRGCGFCYKYSSSRACLSASKSAWQDIRQKGMLCWNTEHQPHGYGSAWCFPQPPWIDLNWKLLNRNDNPMKARMFVVPHPITKMSVWIILDIQSIYEWIIILFRKHRIVGVNRVLKVKNKYTLSCLQYSETYNY